MDLHPEKRLQELSRATSELLAAVKETLGHLEQLDHFYKTSQLEQAERRLDVAADDFAFKNAVA